MFCWRTGVGVSGLGVGWRWCILALKWSGVEAVFTDEEAVAACKRLLRREEKSRRRREEERGAGHCTGEGRPGGGGAVVSGGPGFGCADRCRLAGGMRNRISTLPLKAICHLRICGDCGVSWTGGLSGRSTCGSWPSCLLRRRCAPGGSWCTRERLLAVPGQGLPAKMFVSGGAPGCGCDAGKSGT